MRIVTYGAACSLDGFIAPPDGSMDWLHLSRDVQEFMNTYWASIDTMLMGRKIRWDVKDEKILDDTEASKLLTRPYRAPWRLA